MTSKNYLSYLSFIESVKREEKSIIFGQNYIVLSKKAYEALIDYYHPELKSVSYDELSMHEWIKNKFLNQDRNE